MISIKAKDGVVVQVNKSWASKQSVHLRDLIAAVDKDEKSEVCLDLIRGDILRWVVEYINIRKDDVSPLQISKPLNYKRMCLSVPRDGPEGAKHLELIRWINKVYDESLQEILTADAPVEIRKERLLSNFDLVAPTKDQMDDALASNKWGGAMRFYRLGARDGALYFNMPQLGTLCMAKLGSLVKGFSQVDHVKRVMRNQMRWNHVSAYQSGLEPPCVCGRNCPGPVDDDGNAVSPQTQIGGVPRPSSAAAAAP